MNSKTREILEKMYDMKAAEFMDPRAWDMPMLEKDEDVSIAFFMLRSNNHAWVVENEKSMKLAGVVERTDLLRAMLPPDSLSYAYGSVKLHRKNIMLKEGAKVKDIMTAKLIEASPNDTVKDIMLRMKKYDLERLPVVDANGVLTGEVTLKSIIIHFTRLIRE